MKLFFFFLILTIALPGFAQEDDDAMIEKVQEQKRKQLEKMQKIMLESTGKNQSSSLPPEIQALGYKEINLKALSDPRVVRHLQKMFEKSPLIKMKESQVQEALMEKARGSFMEGILRDNPKLLSCLADIMRDKKAMPSIMGIFLRQGDLFIYLFVWIGFMAMTAVLKKIVLNDYMRRLQRILIGTGISLAMSTLSLYSFYKIFEPELGPAAHIVMKHWKS